MFQSLIGTIQTFCAPQTTYPASKFQSLIGTIQTPWFTPDGKLANMFQSLIGTIQTKYRYCTSLSVRPMFQSLIGTIQTWKKTQSTSLWKKFQSLIGTIQTRFALVFINPQFKVSIPHRYDTNHEIEKKWVLRTLVSIPHRYDTNLPRKSLITIFLFLFQSLIGTIQTRKWKELILFRRQSFNPS